MRSLPLAMFGALALGAVVVHAVEPGPDMRSPSDEQRAHPPTVLSSDQLAALKRILAPYKADTLTAEKVRAIRSAMDSAGLRSGPALDAALAREGFSRKRMEELLPSPARATEGAASAAAGRFPRPQ